MPARGQCNNKANQPISMAKAQPWEQHLLHHHHLVEIAQLPHLGREEDLLRRHLQVWVEPAASAQEAQASLEPQEAEARPQDLEGMVLWT